MRPRELVLNGFRSYESETRFCWEGRSLVGIVGPIGSGKSTILDGIALALYGQTPRSGAQTGSLINQRRDAAQVSLTFEVDGVVYKAVRILRSQSAHALYRIDDGEEIVLADRKREMDAQIEVLLGLDFPAFQRSVLLAQNRFAEFLEATEGQRDQVLKGVFGFDRLDAMRAVAKERIDRLGARRAVLEDRRATADSDRADLERRRTELHGLEERASALDGLRIAFEEANQVISTADTKVAAARERLERIDGLAPRIPDRERAEAILTAATESTTRVAAAEAVLSAASDAKAAAAAALDEVLASVGGRSGLERAGDLVAAWRAAAERRDATGDEADRAEQRLSIARERSVDATAAVAAAEVAATGARDAEAAAVVAVDEADAAVHDAQQSHRAHALRGALVVGEPCPVCAQEVQDLPAGAVPESIEAAQTAAASARTRRADASAAAREAAEALARATTAAAAATVAVGEAEVSAGAARERHESVGAELDSSRAAVVDAIGGGDPAEALETIRSSAAGADAEAEAASGAEAAARADLEDAHRAARVAGTDLGGLRTEVAAVAGAIGIAIEIGEGPDEVGRALRLVREGWIEQRATADDDVEATVAELAAGRAALIDLLEAAELGVSDDLAAVAEAAVKERSAKEAEVAFLEQRLADLEDLAADEADLVERLARLERLRVDLAPSKFLRHVLDERRQVLGDLAGEHFELLSAGRYRFDGGGAFDVVDLTWAEDTRDASSLSGGETFLASLALALALAEIVSREGGRLDAFFLDEGFGSLDPEHLDLAMSGVERLVTTGPDRLVVVVSHVPDLNDRIEDLIVLDRDPTTGDTRVVSGSGC